MNVASYFGSSATPSPKEREAAIRAWIARKESVCPYAPGLARFIVLPEIREAKMSHVYYLATELRAFYDAKEKGKRVGRWMILPHTEWQSHEEAHEESEKVFWLLNAAYYHIMKDKKSMQAAMDRTLPGYDRGYKGDILNPIVGKQPNPNSNVVPAKSLFYSALSPLYRNKKFYRYSPYSIMPLVYASEFHELKLKHPKVTESVCFEMACSGLTESFGSKISFSEKSLKEEIETWGSIIDRTAEIIRSQQRGVCSFSDEVKGCPASNLSYFRLSDPKLVNAFFVQYHRQLPVMKSIISRTKATPQQVMCAAFAGSGLYVEPDYYPSVPH